MNLKLISCEIFCREMENLRAQSPHSIDVRYLQKGLHDIPTAAMQSRIQTAIDAASEPGCDAVLLGYGLCSNGMVGLQARAVQLIVPRAHDCITLFFGSRARRRDYLDAHPGTFFRTSGWIERDAVSDDLKPLSIPAQTGMDLSHEALAERYGEDNAEYLLETLCNTGRNYSRIAFIEMGVEPDDRFERMAEDEAAARGWSYEKLAGDLSLMRCLLNGFWDDEDFLHVPPGHRIVATHDGRIFTARPR